MPSASGFLKGYGLRGLGRVSSGARARALR